MGDQQTLPNQGQTFLPQQLIRSLVTTHNSMRRYANYYIKPSKQSFKPIYAFSVVKQIVK